MKCPVCPDTTLLMSERQGVEIDYCPSCRGVWLDRGELDKLIQLSGSPQATHQAEPQRAPAHRPTSDHPRRDFDDSDFGKHRSGHHRKKSWLSDIFD